ncbi:hypothetical protein I307_05889 [Cryptococcus deuterogattii 99/473]|uniref:MARVEL domain-containing protein n=2 Tax=Cryptococcus deuterogattii TaxID=1859096 RepID=A0A0D0V844_9TREE|nr:hypothetical protein CNBG_3303 [Cryptococcus deuterogattii R265]KIR25006.1 hypothetical protein I309_06173 [Cryptococcus deuterogattii LA55]KIR37121.1 hypothetical protein I352_00433 [Cryptococcus deuterogattii MMRL2647]KIR43591.1 hypothetical protein I313_00433 [Cryptococcus deuterogattii Ram5]KIR74925.1 hypothetical protein I310_01199 [Cryptococcus deuterogattii CA1014]KIR92594.1 hypothetical protein I304_03171 [Cryptococcus deuterogattii CBS 10090]KIR97915.1 hypothetical protein L804_04
MSPPTDPEATAPHRRFSVRALFRSTRHIFYVILFTLWICIDIALLGLVSQQIHKYGRFRENYPSGKYQNALGLLLFSTIVGLLFGIFHWALGLTMYIPILIAFGAWFGTGAGILEGTPFGHGLQCRHTWDLSRFPTAWQPYVGECSRVTAIEGLAWSMFALSVLGLFWVIVDKYNFVSKRSSVYELAEQGETIGEKH